MAKVEVYVTSYCPYCVKAKTLLDMKKAEYEVIDITGDDDARIALVEKSGGRRTVPQVFINDEPVGGFDELNALNMKGELDKMLEA